MNEQKQKVPHVANVLSGPRSVRDVSMTIRTQQVELAHPRERRRNSDEQPLQDKQHSATFNGVSQTLPLTGKLTLS